MRETPCQLRLHTCKAHVKLEVSLSVLEVNICKPVTESMLWANRKVTRL